MNSPCVREDDGTCFEMIAVVSVVGGEHMGECKGNDGIPPSYFSDNCGNIRQVWLVGESREPPRHNLIDFLLRFGLNLRVKTLLSKSIS